MFDFRVLAGVEGSRGRVCRGDLTFVDQFAVLVPIQARVESETVIL